VGHYHHGMARPQVADGGTASNMEGSCKYIELAVADSRQRGDPPASGLGELLKTPQLKNYLCYETRTRASDLD
jgi:hypothetical protein